MQTDYIELRSENRARITVDEFGQVTLTRDFYNTTTGELIIDARSDVVDLGRLVDLKDSFADNLADITDLILDVEEKILEWEEAQIPEEPEEPEDAPE